MNGDFPSFALLRALREKGSAALSTCSPLSRRPSFAIRDAKEPTTTRSTVKIKRNVASLIFSIIIGSAYDGLRSGELRERDKRVRHALTYTV